MEFSLVSVTAQDADLQGVLVNLNKMYCCEWSQYTGMDVDDAGRYAFEKYLPSYWEAADRKAFLLRCQTQAGETKWGGFALLDRDFFIHQDYDHALAELFVLPKYRKQGAGRFMTTTLFDRFPGRWEVGTNPKNLTAARFWEQTIAKYTSGKYVLILASPAHRYIDGTLGNVFSFES